MVNFSCPGGVILGCPLDLSSEPLLAVPLPLVAPAGCSFPFTAVNREVGDSGWTFALCSVVAAILVRVWVSSDGCGPPPVPSNISRARLTRSKFPKARWEVAVLSGFLDSIDSNWREWAKLRWANSARFAKLSWYLDGEFETSGEVSLCTRLWLNRVLDFRLHNQFPHCHPKSSDTTLEIPRNLQNFQSLFLRFWLGTPLKSNRLESMKWPLWALLDSKIIFSC
jgi:hypothetical protein